MAGVRLSELHGVGEVTLRKLERVHDKYRAHREGALTCVDFLALTSAQLQEALGPRQVDVLRGLCRGLDGRVVHPTGIPSDRLPAAVGSSMNYAVRPQGVGDVERILKQLATATAAKLRRFRAEALGLKVILWVRHPDAPHEPQKYMGCGRCVEHAQSSGCEPPMSGDQEAAVVEKACELCVDILKKVDVTDVRGVGLRLSRLQPSVTPVQRGATRAATAPTVADMLIQASKKRPRPAEPSNETVRNSKDEIVDVDSLASAHPRKSQLLREASIIDVDTSILDVDAQAMESLETVSTEEVESFSSSEMLQWIDRCTREHLQSFKQAVNYLLERDKISVVRRMMRLYLVTKPDIAQRLLVGFVEPEVLKWLQRHGYNGTSVQLEL